MPELTELEKRRDASVQNCHPCGCSSQSPSAASANRAGLRAADSTAGDRDNWIGLFYSVQPRGMIVHALVHLSRSPETIRDRIRRLLGYSRSEN